MANYTAAKQFGVLVFVLILVHWGSCKNANCDVNHCKSLFSTVFKDFFKKGTQRLCRSPDDTKECVDICLKTFFPDFEFLNTKPSIVTEVCSYDFQYEYDLDQHWNCISNHFHRLLTCMSQSGSMMPTDITSENLKLLSCRKFLEALNCPDEILHDCGEKAAETVTNLFSNIFKASIGSACYMISSYEAFDLRVMYNLNRSYASTSSCLDKLPDVAGNCFIQYIEDFDANDLYHCRNPCETLGETCLPSSLMNDFYIPVLSFGKHSCKEDSTIAYKEQMQIPTKASTISYNSDIASDVYSEDSIKNPADQNDYVPSDEAKSDISPMDSSGAMTSTLNHKLSTKEVGYDKVLSTIHSSNNFPSPTSIVTSEVHPEIDSLSSGYAENNGAYRLEYYIQCFVTSFITVFVFL